MYNTIYNYSNINRYIFVEHYNSLFYAGGFPHFPSTSSSSLFTRAFGRCSACVCRTLLEFKNKTYSTRTCILFLETKNRVTKKIDDSYNFVILELSFCQSHYFRHVFSVN